MSEPEEVRFACIGCGTLNAAGAEVCAGCGHRFAGTDVVAGDRVAPRPRPPLRPRPVENPYEPPAAPIARDRSFRIGPALIAIAVIAVCLGAFRQGVGPGIAATLSLIPASVRTPIVSGRRRAEGRPLDFAEQFHSFLMTSICSWAVALSALIAFFATCLPAGLASGNVGISLIIGIAAGIGFAAWLTAQFVKMGRSVDARDRENRYR